MTYCRQAAGAGGVDGGKETAPFLKPLSMQTVEAIGFDEHGEPRWTTRCPTCKRSLELSPAGDGEAECDCGQWALATVAVRVDEERHVAALVG